MTTETLRTTGAFLVTNTGFYGRASGARIAAAGGPSRPVRDEEELPVRAPRQDVGEGQALRGVPEVAKVPEVDDAEDARGPVPLPRELLVGEVEARAARLLATEVEF